MELLSCDVLWHFMSEWIDVYELQKLFCASSKFRDFILSRLTSLHRAYELHPVGLEMINTYLGNVSSWHGFMTYYVGKYCSARSTLPMRFLLNIVVHTD